jgi:hypothetical protein
MFARRKEQEAATFIEKTTHFENDAVRFVRGSDLHPSIERDESYKEGSLSGPSSKRRWVII